MQIYSSRPLFGQWSPPCYSRWLSGARVGERCSRSVFTRLQSRVSFKKSVSRSHPSSSTRSDRRDRDASQDYRGKFVLLNFWATWCPPCLEEMPSMEALHQRLMDRARLRGRSPYPPTKEGAEDRAGLHRQARTSPSPSLLDPDQRVSSTRYGAKNLPTSFLIDREGRVVAAAQGERDWSSQGAISYVEEIVTARVMNAVVSTVRKSVDLPARPRRHGTVACAVCADHCPVTALGAAVAADDPRVAVVNGHDIRLSYVYEQIESLPLGEQIVIRERFDRFVDSLDSGGSPLPIHDRIGFRRRAAASRNRQAVRGRSI